MSSPSTPLQDRRRPAAIAIGPQTSTRSISVVPATDATFALSGDVTLAAGDIEIGAVELKNATTDDRAKIAVPASIGSGDIVVGVHDPILNVAQWLGSTAPTIGQKTTANSIPVTLPSDLNQTANAATIVTSIPGSASSVTLLVANTLRIIATIFNDSTAFLYVKFGTMASLADFTVRIPPRVYYEVPVGRDGKIYNGRIDGIWVSATGFAKVMEVS